MVAEGVDKLWIKLARIMPWLRPESIFERHKALLTFLKCAMIPQRPWAPLFTKKGKVLLLQNMVYMMRKVGSLDERNSSKPFRVICDEDS